MNAQSRKRIFDAVRTLRNGQGYTLAEVRLLDSAIDAALAGEAYRPPSVDVGRRVSPKGIALIHSFEGCRLTAYPDPGSRDGTPWTIGWGSTGPDIKKGTVWTQEQADERFRQDLRKFEDGVAKHIGATPTTQAMFDALVSLSYNIGLGAFSKSTLLRRHLAHDYAAAAEQFGRWVFNDGKKMRGLERRRAAEAAHYRSEGFPK